MKRLALLVVLAAALCVSVFTAQANAWWQVTAGHCEGHGVGDIWQYGGNVYFCGWTQTGYYTFVWR